MDILSQYQKDHPEQFRSPVASTLSPEYGFFIRLVMRLSGGRIRDARTASKVLLFVAGVVAAITLLFYVFGSVSSIKQPAKDLINRPQPQ